MNKVSRNNAVNERKIRIELNGDRFVTNVSNILIGAFPKTQKHKSTNICVGLTQICVLS